MLREKNRCLSLKIVHWPVSSDRISSYIDKIDQQRIHLTWFILILFVAYSCYLSNNSNDIHVARFIFPLVRGKYLYNDATFCIQKCTRTSKVSMYPSKRPNIVSTTNCGKFQMLYRKGQKASIEISIYPVTLRLIQKLFTETVHGNFHVSCNIETNIIKKICFYL